MQRPMLTQLGPIAWPKRLRTIRMSGWRDRFWWRDRAGRQAQCASDTEGNPPAPAFPAAPTRFQAGALTPVQEEISKGPVRQGKRTWRLFDKALLVAEVASAFVVVWLVAQYIYTAYIDTTPHRTGSNRSVAVAGISTIAAPTATRTAKATLTKTRMATITPLSEVAPPVQGSGQEQAQRSGNAATEEGAVSEGGLPPSFASQGPPEPVGAVSLTSTPAATAIPTATPTTDPEMLLPTRLRIPVMFLDSPVHEVQINMGTWEVSPMDIGHHEGSANPGETGNMVLAGHRDINSALFRDLDRLKPGDEVFVSNDLREYRYIVNDSFVVTPNHTEVMDPTDDKRVTLITCTPIGLATQRLIVTALLDETYGQEQPQGDR